MDKRPNTAPRSRHVASTLSGERVRAFVPPPLPPNPQTLDLASLQAILAEANQAIGRLDGTTSSLPDLKLFLYSYVRKEAVLSSQIEGTQSSLSDLLLYECVFRSMWAGNSARCGHLILFDVGRDSVVMWAAFVVLP
jgi:hypothetical protein